LPPGSYVITSSWAGNSIVSNTSLYASQSQWSISASYVSSSTRSDTSLIQNTNSTNTSYLVFVSNTASYQNNYVTTSITVNAGLGRVTAVSFTGSHFGNTIGTSSYSLDSGVIIKSPTEPVTPTEGLLWWDTDDATINTIVSSSYALSSTTANTATSSSYSLFALSASWAPGSQTVASISSSWASSSVSASYATLALNVINGSVSSSYALSALSASYVLNSNPSVSASYASSSTTAGTATNLGLTTYNIFVTYASQSQWAVSASYASRSLSASYAPFTQIYQSNTTSASWASSSLSSSYLPPGNYSITASWVVNLPSHTASWAGNAIVSNTSFYSSQSRWSISSSYASSSISSSYSTIAATSISSSYVLSSSYAPGSPSVSASYALTSSYSLNGGGGPSISSSYALTASYALNGGGGPSVSSSYASTASWASNLVLTSSVQTTGSYFLISDDNGKIITFTNATTNSIVVPSGLPTNFNCFFVSISTGSVLVTGSGVQLNNANNCFKLSGRYSAASLVGYLPDAYILFGDVSI
jgi:hypothetical protein